MSKNQQLKKMKHLRDLLDKYKLFPQRFLIITDNGKIIYSYSNRTMSKIGYGVLSFGSIFRTTGSFSDRGRIIDDVLKLEFLIAQIIVVKLSNKNIDFFNYREVKQWNKFIDGITFNNKIQFLRNFNLINKRDEKVLNKIKDFRNQAAHSLSDKYLVYANNVTDKRKQATLFRKDLEKAWTILVGVYNGIWNNNDIIDYTIDLIQKKYAK